MTIVLLKKIMNRSSCEHVHSELKSPSPEINVYFIWQQLNIEINSFPLALNKNLILYVSHFPFVHVTEEEGVVVLPILGVNPENLKESCKECDLSVICAGNY